jgi:sRNA-binding protein
VRAEAALFLKEEDARPLHIGMYQFQKDPSDGY